MKRTIRLAVAGVFAGLTVVGSIALAQSPGDNKASTPQDAMQLPPGMTEEDMMACMAAATPGEMHAYLAKDVGVWHGKTKMWMMPNTEPMTSECTATVEAIMDGRFTKCEIKGEMPGMGPFLGFGIYGYDNVSEQFQSSWIDNFGTGIMNGTGELSADGTTMTWTFTFNCPITKKPQVMREIERRTGENTKVMEMYGTNPITGEEFKMMEISFTRTPAKTAAVSSPAKN